VAQLLLVVHEGCSRADIDAEEENKEAKQNVQAANVDLISNHLKKLGDEDVAPESDHQQPSQQQ